MAKLENKYDNFNKAIKRLKEATTFFKKYPNNEMYRDALIKRFEFTFELAWKSLRTFLIEQGYQVEVSSPKGIISFAYQENFLNNEELWLEMLSDRNMTSHDYGDEFATTIANNISKKYSKALSELLKMLSKFIR